MSPFVPLIYRYCRRNCSCLVVRILTASHSLLYPHHAGLRYQRISIIGIDIWEHAYYYENLKADYLEAN